MYNLSDALHLKKKEEQEMKKRIAFSLLLISLVVMGGCHKKGKTVTSSTKKSSEKIEKTTTTSSKTSQTSQSMTTTTSQKPTAPEASFAKPEETPSTTTASKTQTTHSLWSEEKSQALTQAIAKQDEKLEPFYPEHDTNYYGILLPKNILSGQVKVEINGNLLTPTWWQPNQTTGFQVVGLYSDVNHQKITEGHVYLFTLNENTPKVYLTMQTQGNANGSLVFDEVSDSSLQALFEKIFTE